MTDRTDIAVIYDQIEELRSAYLRELAGLSRVFIAIASALLALLLSPFAIDLSAKVGVHLVSFAWGTLALVAFFGFLQLFLFSTRFRSRAEYVRACHLADMVVDRPDSEATLSQFLTDAENHQRSSELKFRACVALAVAQGVLLLASFSLLAACMLRAIRGAA